MKNKNYKIVLNKIFAGSFLVYNLGHEIINFIKDDDGQRYVYLTPWGNRGDDANGKTEYAFHIISSIYNGKRAYELVAVSIIDNEQLTIYNKDREKEKAQSPKFNGHSFYDIFYCGDDSDKAHIYTYKAKKILVPKEGQRIIIEVKQEASGCDEDEGVVRLQLTCNAQRNMCYANNDDVRILDEFLCDGGYLEESDETIDINSIDDEQCFAIISGRARLELSTSNQIAYFLQRDKHLVFAFLHDFLGINGISEKEKFNIVREREDDIDLLFASDQNVIVIENKIDSSINHVEQTPNEEGKYSSQLHKYYEYVENKFQNQRKFYFVLAPEYNSITREELNEKYVDGEHYTLISYKELFKFLKDIEYRPNNNIASQEGQFLFEQFKKSIEYLTWPLAKQYERTAYIRLKQRMEELETN